jgi:glycosyltransferase involved in cell wall biosynthesis
MSQSPADISVVLCAYTTERWDDLIAAVASVRGQTLRPREIIVVIDHNPAMLERARAQFPDAMVIENRAPRGLSGARNSGVEAAHGDVVAFLDDDAEAAPDWLELLSAEYVDNNVMGVGGSIEPLWLGGRPAWFPEEFQWVVGCTYRGMPEALAPTRNLIGCNMSLRRELFASIGGFRTGIGRIGTLPVGCEETELCIRARQRWPERELLFQPAARVRHRVPAIRGAWAYFWSRCYAEGISKAQVAHFVGSGDGLASERTYTLRVLPLGVLRGFRDTLCGDLSGAKRSAAIIAGLALTTAGFAKGMLREQLKANREQPTYIRDSTK